LFGRHPVLPKAIQADADTVLANMDNPDTWAPVSEQHTDLFKRVMPMALENLSIAQHRDTLRYVTIRGGGYRPQVRRFQPGDYVYLQQTAPTTLDVTMGRIILQVREVLGSGVLLLEGHDGKFWKDHTCNCAPYHLPHIDGTVYPGTFHIPAGLRCRLCGVLNLLLRWLFVIFVLLGGIWSVLLHHFWRFQLDSGLVPSALGV
jgi:hypothetical protein